MDATVKFATAAPEGVKRSSGSAVRLPMSVMGVSPAMGAPCVSWTVVCGSAQVTVPAEADSRPGRAVDLWTTHSREDGLWTDDQCASVRMTFVRMIDSLSVN
ncbi:hypothetical protein GCM10022197_24770 [Microlunatus spumicola]|uniref:Uncharacterized protein n=1 Tax=Microlunatus spumicola TaxID=81499 RepID=A0ABP6XIL1_9ACTN